LDRVNRYASAAVTVACAALCFASWKALLYASSLVGGLALLACVVGFALAFLIGIWWTYELFREERFNRRERKGLCIRCGFDLRASLGKCPECGFPITLRGTPTERDE
jgi:hypothetical protein